MKTFNTTAVCIPTKHFMVDLGSRLVQIKKMLDDGKYFTINRARQYGKTTTLAALSKFLAPEYLVISLDFQGIGNAGFSSEEDFAQSFCRLIKREKGAVWKFRKRFTIDWKRFYIEKNAVQRWMNCSII